MQAIAGSTVKLLIGLGDRFAVTCTMVATEEDTHNPQVIDRICNALLFIFGSGPFLGISSDCYRDRYPVYSIFLLERLRAGTGSDPHSQALIERTLELLRAAATELAENDRLKEAEGVWPKGKRDVHDR